LFLKITFPPLFILPTAGVVKLALVVGDVLTAPQFGLSYQEFANYLSSL
jgi:hypothetical protein